MERKIEVLFIEQKRTHDLLESFLKSFLKLAEAEEAKVATSESEDEGENLFTTVEFCIYSFVILTTYSLLISDLFIY